MGCLEGGYTVELARAGFDALGIEVRRSNFENCQRVKAGTNLPNLTFACDDVHNLAKYGVFDAVFCCGLLYHLDEPRKFVDLMAQVVPAGRHHRYPRRRMLSRTASLSFPTITENEGWAGRWFSEFDDDNTRHKDKWSSWSNRRSFWPMKRDLMQGLLQAGFTMVLESPIFEPYLELTHRATIVALKD